MGIILEAGVVGNRIWQEAKMPQGLEPDSYLVYTFLLMTTLIDIV